MFFTVLSLLISCASNGQPELESQGTTANSQGSKQNVEPQSLVSETTLKKSEDLAPPTPELQVEYWRSNELSAPESVLYQLKSDRIWVSNIIGNPSVKDGVGRVVELTKDGKVKSPSFTSGVKLHAPKGMCILDDALYIADIDVVHVVSLNSGEHRYDVPITDAVFLNDMTCSFNEAYVSDSSTGRIHRIYKEGKSELVVDLSPIKPNGIAFQGMDIYVADFNSGAVLRLTPSGEIEKQWRVPKGGLDGLVVMRDGSVVVSSWEAQGLYRLKSDDVQLLVSGINSPADFAVDTRRNRLLVPQLTEDQIQVVTLPWPSTEK